MEGVSVPHLTTAISVYLLSACSTMSLQFRCFILFACIVISSHQRSCNGQHITTTPGHMRIIDICPGVEYLMSQNSTDITILQANASSCENHLLPHAAHQGVIYGVCGLVAPFCTLHVQVPHGRHVRARIQRLSYDCDSRHWKIAVLSLQDDACKFLLECYFHDMEESFIDTHLNKMQIINIRNPLIVVYIESIEYLNFIVKPLLDYSNCIIIPHMIGSDDMQLHYAEDFRITMTYIIHFQQISYDAHTRHSITLNYLDPNTALKQDESVCVICCPSPTILHTSQLQIKVDYLERFHAGLKLFLSVLPRNKQPVKLPSGLFNCSVPWYSDFQPHLHCNQCPECHDGQDETGDCPFSSEDCKGLVASRNKCFKLILLDKPLGIPIVFSYIECHKDGGQLADVKTKKEKLDYERALSNYVRFEAAIGLRSGWQSVSFLYSKFRIWFDTTLIYNMNHFHLHRHYVPSRSFDFAYATNPGIKFKMYNPVHVSVIICELELKSNGVSRSLMVFAHVHSSGCICMHTRQRLFICPTRFAAHLFLSYGAKSDCMREMDSKTYSLLNVSCVYPDDMSFEGRPFTFTLFRCDDETTTVHHTLLCDFRQDCPDGSDESFCEFTCAGFLCLNGQSVLLSQRCNQYTDCVDDSDEVGCSDDATYHAPIKDEDMKQQFYVDLDGTGYFTQQLMKTEDLCPYAHYQCSSEWLYCLPIYTRCNGVFDCVYGEDENECETFRCLGLYKCQASSTCVHGDHLCDGWGQCPQRDDELMCDTSCPEGCRCQGHIFLCSEPFVCGHFPLLRYVNATDSNMPLSDFNTSIYLVALILSHCLINNISHITLLNLRYIDLAQNNVKTLDMAVFLQLPNLRILNIENNPLCSITSETTKPIVYLLDQMDLSQTYINIFDNNISIFLPHVVEFDASYCGVETIGGTGLKNMPQIQELDLRGNILSNVPLDLLLRSDKLQRIYSSNYRICCQNVLPRHLDAVNCFAPVMALPSCTSLLPNELYRAFFGLVAVSAVTGHVACFLLYSTVKDMTGSSFMMAITHLQLADISMGCHVMVIVIADLIFRGKYMQMEKAWTNSVMCRVAGFLFSLSSSVSPMIIWFTTLYHIIVYSLFNHLWIFKQCLIDVVCTVIWILGVLLASVPFLPGMSHWGLQDQSGLCRLALADHYYSRERFTWFSVIVAIDFILCLMIGGGQGIIFWRTPKYRITLNPTQRLVYSSVHVIRKVAVTDAFCWFVFGVTVMIYFCGVADFVKIRDTMVIFILPFNSALNPLLYIWTVHTQWQRQEQEQKLLRMLKSRARTGKDSAVKLISTQTHK